MTNLRNIGIVAHVDAGKTTLTEQILFQSGLVRVLGSVDKGSSTMDWSKIERERGITVFAEQGVISWKGTQINLIDTPGHSDFTPELERCLLALDGAVLILSAVEGVQSHTLHIWQRLRRLSIPTLIFVNKLDRVGADLERVYQEIKEHLTPAYLPLQKPEGLEKEFHGVTEWLLERKSPADWASYQTMLELLAGLDDGLMEKYCREQEITTQDIFEGLRRVTSRGRAFPVLLGSTLQGIGVTQLLNAVVDFLPPPQGDLTSPFQGIIYKIRMEQGSGQLSYVRVYQGKVKTRESILTASGEIEKITQIRKYTGSRYVMVDELGAGDIGVVCGLKNVKIGEFIGSEKTVLWLKEEGFSQVGVRVVPEESVPVLVCEISPMLPEQLPNLLKAFEVLDKEEPSLNLKWEPETQSLQIHLNGLIQIEVLKALLKERFCIEVRLNDPQVYYLETITKITRGFCHFEPKKHYAEVEVEIEPLDRGKGIEFVSNVSLDDLPGQFQNAIAKAIPEALLRGTLGRYEMADVRVTLVAGKFHLEHTHGGDFRIATIRAIQQALEKNQSILLEPIYLYQIIIVSEFAGRIIADILRMKGSMNEPELSGERVLLTGKIPVATALSYPIELTSLTSGKGLIRLNVGGYERCHNEAEILQEKTQLDKEHSSSEDILYNSVTLFREKRKMKKVTTTD